MAGWLDSGWLKALDLKGSTALFLALGFGTIYLLAQYGLFSLDQLPGWLIAIFVTVGIVSFFIFLSRLWESITKQISKWIAKRKREKATIEHFDTLNEKEKAYLGTLLRDNTRSFNTHAVEGTAHSLMAKGIIYRAEGMGDIIEWPYLVPKFVWDELQKRKDEFIEFAPSTQEGYRL